jgi:hypothetical protein
LLLSGSGAIDWIWLLSLVLFIIAWLLLAQTLIAIHEIEGAAHIEC